MQLVLSAVTVPPIQPDGLGSDPGAAPDLRERADTQEVRDRLVGRQPFATRFSGPDRPAASRRSWRDDGDRER